MKSVRVIIAGSREFTDYEYLKNKLDIVLEGFKGYNELEIVSGACRGVDQLGERYAIENGLPIKHFPADWKKDGKGAGFKRNTQMAKYANMLIAFQIGDSKGTQHMINTAIAHKLRVLVFRPDGHDYVIESNPLLVMSSEQEPELPQDILFNKTTHKNMTFSRTKIGFDLNGQPKDKDADFYLWRKRMDEVESISKIEYSKAKFISVPQGVVCLFEATEPPAGTKVNIVECPYLAILLHSVEYKTKNWDTGAQDTVKPTAGELAYIEFLMNEKLVDSEDLLGEGFFRFINDPETLKENTKFCFGITYHADDPHDFNSINAIAKQIKESAGATNGNGKTYAPKQTAKERLAELKPLVLEEIRQLAFDGNMQDLLTSVKLTTAEYLSLLFK